MITLCRERRASESIQNILDAGTANLESSSRSRRAIEVNIYCTEDGWKDFFCARKWISMSGPGPYISTVNAVSKLCGCCCLLFRRFSLFGSILFSKQRKWEWELSQISNPAISARRPFSLSEEQFWSFWCYLLYGWRLTFCDADVRMNWWRQCY